MREAPLCSGLLADLDLRWSRLWCGGGGSHLIASHSGNVESSSARLYHEGTGRGWISLTLDGAFGQRKVPACDQSGTLSLSRSFVVLDDLFVLLPTVMYANHELHHR